MLLNQFSQIFLEHGIRFFLADFIRLVPDKVVAITSLALQQQLHREAQLR